MITSDDLTTAVACLPTAKPRSSTASLVMDDMMTKPGAISILTWAVVAPRLTETILPGKTPRILPLPAARWLAGVAAARRRAAQSSFRTA
jgi:hypothetical protein